MFADAVPLDGRGRRSPGTVLRLAVRDHLLREAARRFCVGMSDRAAAKMLHVALLRYRAGRWRRSCADATCPHDAGRIEGTLWMILRTRDYVPSVMTVRRALAFRDPVTPAV